jgi:alanine dehydrogenase
MVKNLRVGILRETKNPPDRRVAVGPEQAVELTEKFPNVELFIQSSDNRCFKDEEYSKKGLNVVDDISNCDILIGVKEVAKSKLLPNKKYLFFSHTAKKQSYNKELLNKILDLKIQMIDYEYLTDTNNVRLVAFGRWAGLVGAYNGLITYGEKHNLYKIKRAKDCFDLNELNEEIKNVKLPAIKILITGGGRVAHGAIETLSQIKDIKQVTHSDFLNKIFKYPVYCQIDPWNYAKRKDDGEFNLQHFFNHPYEYESTFLPYTKVTDFYIPCHFWDQRSPVFMTNEDMKSADFKMDVIADVSCDIAGPIPSTIRPSTIAEPLYGYNAKTEKEVDAFEKGAVTVMAVDNLPGELPRNTSVDFGIGLVERIFPSLFGEDTKGVVNRASITTLDGKLSDLFSYLQNFTDGKE